MFILLPLLAFACECDWEGHCLGEPCEFFDEAGNGCANDYLCDQQSMICVEKNSTTVCVNDLDCGSGYVCQFPVSEETFAPLSVAPCETPEETFAPLSVAPCEETFAPLSVAEPTTTPCEETFAPLSVAEPTTTPCATITVTQTQVCY